MGRLHYLLMLGLGLVAGTAHAACSSPAGAAGDQLYDSGSNSMVFCNGTGWVTMAGATSVVAAGGSSGQVQYNSGGSLAGSSALTFSGSTLTATNISATNISVSSGNVIMGYEVTTNTGGTTITASCSAGKQVLGGGCNCTGGGGNYVRISTPNGTTGWSCWCDAGSGNVAYAICAYMK